MAPADAPGEGLMAAAGDRGETAYEKRGGSQPREPREHPGDVTMTHNPALHIPVELLRSDFRKAESAKAAAVQALAEHEAQNERTLELHRFLVAQVDAYQHEADEISLAIDHLIAIRWILQHHTDRHSDNRGAREVEEADRG